MPNINIWLEFKSASGLTSYLKTLNQHTNSQTLPYNRQIETLKSPNSEDENVFLVIIPDFFGRKFCFSTCNESYLPRFHHCLRLTPNIILPEYLQKEVFIVQGVSLIRLSSIGDRDMITINSRKYFFKRVNTPKKKSPYFNYYEFVQTTWLQKLFNKP